MRSLAGSFTTVGSRLRADEDPPLQPAHASSALPIVIHRALVTGRPLVMA